MHFSQPLDSHQTDIPGLVLFDIPVHGDNRGWFKENWQREKMLKLGLPDFGPVQNNISFNAQRGTTRGIHAEPWDKYVSVATGSVFGAWVDLRAGDTFGRVFTAVLDPSRAIFVPRGVANSFQTLEDGTAYTYLVNDHWSADAQPEYTFLNLGDPTVAIDWPIPLSESEISEKDLAHPVLADVEPMPPKRTLVLGANGQLGRALRAEANVRGLTHWDFASRSQIDIGDADSLASVIWRNYDTVINASAYTQVDAAETADGRAEAWRVNALGVSELSRICARNQLTLVHVSTDYVFDGQTPQHAEEETLSPLGVYGQSKAAGECAVHTVPKHFIIRTSWVIGDGNNFVQTMRQLALKEIHPSVVDDQVGRLTFAEDLAAGIFHLLEKQPDFGVYNLSNTGEPATWAAVAARVFELTGADAASVTGVSTETYFAGKSAAPRPPSSVFDLSKIEATGFTPRNQWLALQEYLSGASTL